MKSRTHGCLGQASCVAGWMLVVLAGMAGSPCRAEPAAAPSEAAANTPPSGKSADLQGLLDLPIDQLAKAPVVVPSMDIPVTSVTKEQSTVGRLPAAVFVITNEMIRRSGATCIPEALRMCPDWTWHRSIPTPGR